MQTNNLQRKHKNKKRMTVARGGKRGKTAGRGGKGQTARSGNKRRPEWRDIIKKLPKLRGRGVNQHKPISEERVVVNVGHIEAFFQAGEAVNPQTLVEKGAVSIKISQPRSIKVLGSGEITKAVAVTGCEVSAQAKEKIEKAGGSVK